MTKEFVPYKLAVKLKELGFDEPCFTYYYEDTGKIRTGLSIHIHNGWTYSGTKRLETTLAPTFSQSFRWFREKYDLNYVIVKAESWFYTINGCNTQEGFNTYKEAELACLTKLIKIVQGGNNE
jgi:hypothetical protein